MRRIVPMVAVVALVAAVGGALGACGADGGAGVLRISGSTTVNPVAADAAEVLRAEGMTVTVDASGGSAGGIAQLGAGQVEIAMTSKALAASDRERFPGTDFVATEIGQDAVGIIVRRDVYDAGVTNLTRDQVRALFEGRVATWSELGGPDLPVFVYDKEPGRGTREAIDTYLYGAGQKAPPPPRSDRFAIVGGNEEERAKLLSTEGSVGPLSSSFVEGYPELAAVSLDGVPPTPENVAAARYPMSRPLFLVTDGRPSGAAARFVDYVLSAAGQELVRRHGYLTLADLGKG